MATTLTRSPSPVRGAVLDRDRRETARRTLLAAGIGSSFVYVVALVLGPMRWAGYSTVDQIVSELFAVDAPSRPLVVSLLFVSGLLALAFGIGVVWSAGSDRALRRAGWALVGIGVVDQAGPLFPMHMREVVAAGGGTASDTGHIVLTMTISLLTIVAMGFGCAALDRPFRLYSAASIVVLVVFGALASTQAGALSANEPTPWQGIYERIDIGAYLLWMAVLAVVLLRRPSPGR